MNNFIKPTVLKNSKPIKGGYGRLSYMIKSDTHNTKHQKTDETNQRN